MCIFSKWTSN